jgi:SNF2 family DNA or RNA helicase
MLLAMTMGAGKTPTTLAVIEELYDEDEVDRCLVVVPASVKFQWHSECKKFTDGLAMVIDGPAKNRVNQWRVSQRFRYVIVSPETLFNDIKMVGKFQAIVLDEASMIKNRSTKRARMMKRIGKTVPYRYALTGQPIENRPEELFSIMEFVDREVLGDYKLFDRTFIVRDHWGRPTRYPNLPLVHKIMKDCMVRKTRADIADQLPDIVYQTVPIPFDIHGAAAYRRIAHDLEAEIQVALKSGSFNLWAHYNGNDNEAQGQIMARLTILRMLCDSPYLVKESARQFKDSSTSLGSQYAHDIVKMGWLDGVTKTPKLDACLEYVNDVLAEDPKNKIVLFSFFKTNLALIQGALSCGSVQFTGDMNAKQKDSAKTAFRNDPNCRVFLSSDAGGYGVDLPMANYLISYDLPWSSGKLEQREARIIRLSSEFPHVTIATFVMQGSIEERQYEMLTHKRDVSEAFIDGKNIDVKGGMTVSLDTLSQFLRESQV